MGLTANFEAAYKAVKKNEGGYANDADDKGGETYAGISRRFNSQWPGWQIVDAHKKLDGFPSNLDNVPELKTLVKEYYKAQEWDVLNLDEFPYRIAEELFDTGVHCGKHTAVEFLQRSLNILNRKNRLWNNIAVDGKLGPITMAAVDACLRKVGEQKLYNMLNHYQAMHYILKMENDETQEKYVGWFDRVNFTNKSR